MNRYLIEETRKFIREYELKTVTKWGDPLIGFADADLSDLKRSISPDHGSGPDVLDAPTVILSYFVPFLKELAATNVGGTMASSQWAQAYEETNALFVGLNEYLIERLRSKGYVAAVPSAAGAFDRKDLISSWSQRHIAYKAGLGTFGINNMLITEKGCCGRLGSIVTNLDLEPGRPMEMELCLHKNSGKCGACIKRCPSGALTGKGFERRKCFQACQENAKIHNSYGNSYAAEAGQAALDTGSEVCGKCVAGMPCAFR